MIGYGGFLVWKSGFSVTRLVSTRVVRCHFLKLMLTAFWNVENSPGKNQGIFFSWNAKNPDTNLFPNNSDLTGW